MGELLSKIKTSNIASSIKQKLLSRKRKREEDECSEDISSALERSLQEPKRKRLLTTTQYIYQALFKEERNSDVTVLALGKTWNLHKVYLCQSPYFASMFNGSWKESTQDFIHIKSLDSKITIESLDKVFGSLYLDEIIIEPVNIVAILATATIFQLDGIIDKCSEVMIETTNAETAIKYYEASCLYGVQSVKEAAFKWLLINLLSFYSKHMKWLKDIGNSLLTKLIDSHELYVMQTEFAVYCLLRTWMFLKLFPNYEPEKDSNEQAKETPEKYFANLDSDTPFLLTAKGKEFEEVFKALRFPHLLIHHVDMKTVLDDNILPKEWLHSFMMEHWSSILKIDHGWDKGCSNVESDIFNSNCMRCGRVLPEQTYQKWRWTGFNFGLDLVLTAESRLITVRRHHKADAERLLSLQAQRKFMIRITVASLNSQRQVIHSQTTGIKEINLQKNEETSLMVLENNLEYPLLVSVNLLFATPDNTEKSIQSTRKIRCNNPTPMCISNIGADSETPRFNSTLPTESSEQSPSVQNSR